MGHIGGDMGYYVHNLTGDIGGDIGELYAQPYWGHRGDIFWGIMCTTLQGT